MWRCVCECGNERSITSQVLTSGKSNSCGCLKFYHDLAGQRFGRLTAMSLHSTANKRYTWKVICDCGNTRNVLTCSLVVGHSQSCGCLNKERSSAAHWKGYEGLGGSHFSHIRKNARHRNIEFHLNIQQAYEIFASQGGICPYTGRKLSLGNKNNIGITASLDRIDSSKPYTVDNCEWVLLELNQMKHALPKRDFIKLVSYIINPIVDIDVNRQIITDKYWSQKSKAMLKRSGTIDISKQDLQNLMDKQRNQCALTGLPLIIPPTYKTCTETNASIDRVDSSKEYSLDNIQLVDKKVNILKQDHSMAFLLSICKEIYDYQRPE